MNEQGRLLHDNELIVAAKADPQARAALVESRDAERFVRSRVRMVMGPSGSSKWSLARDSALDPDDILQEAWMGLLLAIDRFDPSRGVCFPSFASSYIDGRIRSLLRGSAPGGLHIPSRSRQRDGVPFVGSLDRAPDQEASPSYYDTEPDPSADFADGVIFAADLGPALDAADPRVREALRLRRQGLTYKEIGERMGCSRTMIWRWLEAARKMAAL